MAMGLGFSETEAKPRVVGDCIAETGEGMRGHTSITMMMGNECFVNWG